uniref:Uncharacterized protein n=1 Tax=Arundo donax TaxID=35708 RepID=A0A0A9CIA4_ARUDO
MGMLVYLVFYSPLSYVFTCKCPNFVNKLAFC